MTALQKARWVLLGLTLLAVLSAGPAFAAALPVLQFTFDENGHGSETINGGPPTPITGNIAVDPGTGLATLFYPIPGLFPNPVLTSGFVLLFGSEAPGAAMISDVVHFVGLAQTSGVFFYSDPEEPGGTSDLADVTSSAWSGLVQLAISNAPLDVAELPSEGANSAVFPGTVPFWGVIVGSFTSYIFISDAPVPEPSSLFLLATGAGLAGVTGWRRHRK